MSNGFFSLQLSLFTSLIKKRFLMLSMLEYIKTILQKVSFDKALFEKELAKAIQMLIPEEVKQLKRWCYAQFGKMYRVVLNRCFARVRFT